MSQVSVRARIGTHSPVLFKILSDMWGIFHLLFDRAAGFSPWAFKMQIQGCCSSGMASSGALFVASSGASSGVVGGFGVGMG